MLAGPLLTVRVAFGLVGVGTLCETEMSERARGTTGCAGGTPRGGDGALSALLRSRGFLSFGAQLAWSLTSLAGGPLRFGSTVIAVRHVSADYFRAMHIPLRRGRVFTEQDDARSRPVTIVNETAARRYFPGVDPIGRHLANSGDQLMREIVGMLRKHGVFR